MFTKEQQQEWVDSIEGTDHSLAKKGLEEIDKFIIETFFGGIEGQSSRINRFNQFYVTNSEDKNDTEQVEKLANKMLIDDFRKLRQKINECVVDGLKTFVQKESNI